MVARAIYGRQGRFDEIEKEMGKARPGVKLRKSSFHQSCGTSERQKLNIASMRIVTDRDV